MAAYSFLYLFNTLLALVTFVMTAGRVTALEISARLFLFYRAYL
jgi:hypothetical protein